MPKVTALAPVKLEPVMVTPVPPAVDPVAGLTAVTVGGWAVAWATKSAATAEVPAAELWEAVGCTAPEPQVGS